MKKRSCRTHPSATERVGHEEPEVPMGNDTIEISSHWQSGTAFEAAGKKGISLCIGSAPGNEGNTAMEVTLMALAACTGADVVSILEKKRQPASRLEIRVRGTRAAEPPQIYTEIEIEFLVSGTNLTPEAVARAIELSETKYCSVGNMLRLSARMRSSFKIISLEVPHE
jgi:putative redox protein